MKKRMMIIAIALVLCLSTSVAAAVTEPIAGAVATTEAVLPIDAATEAVLPSDAAIEADADHTISRETYAAMEDCNIVFAKLVTENRAKASVSLSTPASVGIYAEVSYTNDTTGETSTETLFAHGSWGAAATFEAPEGYTCVDMEATIVVRYGRSMVRQRFVGKVGK